MKLIVQCTKLETLEIPGISGDKGLTHLLDGNLKLRYLNIKYFNINLSVCTETIQIDKRQRLCLLPVNATSIHCQISQDSDCRLLWWCARWSKFSVLQTAHWTASSREFNAFYHSTEAPTYPQLTKVNNYSFEIIESLKLSMDGWSNFIEFHFG